MRQQLGRFAPNTASRNSTLAGAPQAFLNINLLIRLWGLVKSTFYQCINGILSKVSMQRCVIGLRMVWHDGSEVARSLDSLMWYTRSSRSTWIRTCRNPFGRL